MTSNQDPGPVPEPARGTGPQRCAARPRPALSWCLLAAVPGWWAGLGWQLQQPWVRPAGESLAALGLAALGLGLAALPWWAGRRQADPRPRPGGAWHDSARLQAAALRGWMLSAALLAGFLAGFAFTDLRASARLADVLSPDLEGRDLVVTGTVASLPRPTATGTRFTLRVESGRWPEGGAVHGLPSRLSLGWFHGVTAPPAVAAPVADVETLVPRRTWRLAPAPEHPLHAGDRWELPVRLKRPHGGMNPQGFDLELWMFERALGASGSVRPPGRRLEEAVAHPVERLRQQLRDAIVSTVSDPRTAGVVAALAVGDQAAIGPADWELFRLSGVAHLMSISGLHVTMFAWLAAAVLRVLWRLHPRLMLAVPAPSAARWGGLCLAFGYALLAGWGVPAQRTVVMLAVVVALKSFGRSWPGPVILLAAGGVVSLLDPWAVLQPGFWLSFVAVGVLMAGDEGDARDAKDARDARDAAGSRGRMRWWLQRAARGLGEMLRTQTRITIGLAPLTIVLFQQLSLAGFLANLVAIPYVTLVVTPLSLLGVIHAPLWEWAAVAVGLLMPLLETLASWPGAVWIIPVAPTWAAVAGSIGAALAVLPLPAWMRLTGLPLLLPLLGPPLDRPQPGRFEVIAADVGQGTAVIVRTQRHLLVYDTGPAYTPESDAGQRVLVPLLRGRGERRVDHLVLSHRDADHIGGAVSLMSAFAVARVSSSMTADEVGAERAAEPSGDPTRGSTSEASSGPRVRGLALSGLAARLAMATHTPCAEGQSWQWDGVRFEMLHPTPGGPRPAKANALSCVVRVVAADGTSLLLTGDIEAAQERRLVREQGEALRSTVMTVPHHGSRTSSTPVFVDAVAPRFALVQAAYRSHFGHPAPDVVSRYESRGVEVIRSDRCGAWSWRSGEPAGVCERDRRRRYWHWRPGPEELRSPARSPPDPPAPGDAPPARGR